MPGKVEILQVSSDGPSSYYVVQRNGVDSGEIFMELHHELGMALIRMRDVNEVQLWLATIDLDNPEWILESHKAVTTRINEYWPNSTVEFYTQRGNNA